MNKLLSTAVLSLILSGCCPASKDADRSEKVYGVNERQPEDMEYAAIYVPEAGTYVDYSYNPLSYHYHGRSRDITPQEREIFDATILSMADPDNIALSNRVRELANKYRPLLENLAKSDVERFRADVRELIAEKTNKSNIGTAGK